MTSLPLRMTGCLQMKGLLGSSKSDGPPTPNSVSLSSALSEDKPATASPQAGDKAQGSYVRPTLSPLGDGDKEGKIVPAAEAVSEEGTGTVDQAQEEKDGEGAIIRV